MQAPTLIYVYNAGAGDKWYNSVQVDIDAAEECNAMAAVSDNLVTVTVDEAACDGQHITIDVYDPQVVQRHQNRINAQDMVRGATHFE